ncbi:MAG: hypothetical protein IT329_04935 [Caldilineaceae bacterium]|nr:hypothetical protein [Caldilineaceae bacterium]
MGTQPLSRAIDVDVDYYQQMYDPAWAEQSPRPQTKKARKKPPKTQQIVAELTDETVGLEGGFETTYRPGEFEGVWLLDSLRGFYDRDLLSDILAVVKGGKEANVYRCAGGPGAHAELVAAKVYRPRSLRNLRNDKMYREGRQVLTGDGKAVKNNDHRIMRALNKKTAFGQQVAHTSWLMYEYTTLERLHQAGASVPRPIAVDGNAILMQYFGDRMVAAPTLHEIRLEPQAARRLLDQVVFNLELMLASDMIHGDLSAYNILYWADEMTIIDFPQVTNAKGNSNARFILSRDVRRVCEYFQLQGVNANPRALADHLWQRFQERSANDILADLSRTLETFDQDDV